MSFADDGPVVLRDSTDQAGSRYLQADLRDGALVIEGQDLGDAVEGILGDREYEWAWTVEARDLPAAVVALGGASGQHPLDAVRSWATANQNADPGLHLRAQGVPITFWSRIGD